MRLGTQSHTNKNYLKTPARARCARRQCLHETRSLLEQAIGGCQECLGRVLQAAWAFLPEDGWLGQKRKLWKRLADTLSQVSFPDVSPALPLFLALHVCQARQPLLPSNTSQTQSPCSDPALLSGVSARLSAHAYPFHPPANIPSPSPLGWYPLLPQPLLFDSRASQPIMALIHQ